MAGHQVQPAVAGGARKLAVVEAEHGDQLKRDRALRNHAAKSNPAHQKTLPLGRGGEAIEQQVAHHRKVQQRVFAGAGRFAGEAMDEAQQQGLGLARVAVAGIDPQQRLEAAFQLFCPRAGRQRLGGQLAQRLDLLQQLIQRAQITGRRPFDAGERGDLAAVGQAHAGLAIVAAGVGHQVAAEQAIHRPAEAVLGDRRHPEALPEGGVERPRHPALAQPCGQFIDRVPIQPQPPRYFRQRQQVDHFRRGEAAGGEIEQAPERAKQRVTARHCHVGQVVGQPLARVAGHAEHRGDQRHVSLDVRRHHHDVGGPDRRAEPVRTFQRVQQLVAQYLQLAQAGMAGVHAQRRIGAFGGDRGRRGQRGIHQRRVQLADALLHATQAVARRFGLFVAAMAHVFQHVALAFGQRQHEVLPHAAPAGQQRVRLLHPVIAARRCVDARQLIQPLLAQLRQLARQPAPVLPARVRHIQRHQLLARVGTQHRQFRRRQVADAEHVQRLACLRCVSLLQASDEAVHHVAAMRAEPAAQVLPQRRQQLLLGGGRHAIAAIACHGVEAALLPAAQPVRPVHQVLRVQAGQPVGKLKAATRPIRRRAGVRWRVCGGLLQIAADARVGDAERAQITAQHLMDAPAQMLTLVTRQRHRLLAEPLLRQAVDPRAGQQDVQVGRDAVRAVLARKRAVQPLLHARMRGDQRLRGEHVVRRRRRQQLPQRPEQCLQPAGAVNHQPMHLRRCLDPSQLAPARPCRHCRTPVIGDQSTLAGVIDRFDLPRQPARLQCRHATPARSQRLRRMRDWRTEGRGKRAGSR